jgi:hypothetical protein
MNCNKSNGQKIGHVSCLGAKFLHAPVAIGASHVRYYPRRLEGGGSILHCGMTFLTQL